MRTRSGSIRTWEWPIELLATLLEAADEAGRQAVRRLRRRPPRRGLTLQPGVDTPLWNKLVRQVLPLLRPRGSKAQLARFLGVPRQRIQVCLKAQTGCLDAERTLLLLAWLATRRRRQTGARGRRSPLGC
jgi:hypothetical protein